MGGSIRTIIIKDDKIHSLDSYTNGLPDFVKNDKFIEGDDEYLNKFIAYYISNQPFAPEGYGIDIFDFDKKKIINCQGYCSYDKYDLTSIDIHKMGMIISDVDKSNLPPQSTKRMWDKGMMKLDFENNMTFEESYKYLGKKKSFFVGYDIKWEDFGFEYIRYYDDFEGSVKMLEYVLNLGYKLSNEDIDTWINWRGEIDVEDGEITKEEFNKIKSKFKNYIRLKKLNRIIEDEE